MSYHFPKISIIISTYNDRDLVEKKLNEIQSQSAFKFCEFIFIDAFSPELEYELLQPFCESNPNCHLIRSQERISLYQAWNLGWKMAKAPYVCISNMDDMMHPKLLEIMIREVGRNEWDVLSVLIARQTLDVDWNSWDYERLRKLELITRPGAFFMWRKDLDSELGFFDENLAIVGDKDFWARVRDRGLRVKLVPKLLYLHTKHAGQLSKVDEFRQTKLEERKLCEQKEYSHLWPNCIQWRVRFYRLLPFSFFYEAE
jgi:GT2 family glycosyltransferase